MSEASTAALMQLTTVTRATKSKKEQSEIWLTVEEAAKRMHCCTRTIRDRIYKGELNAFNPAGRLLIKASEIDEMVERHPR